MKLKQIYLNSRCALCVFFLTASGAVLFSGCDGSWQPAAGRSGAGIANSLKADAVRIVRQGLADDDPRVRTNAVEVVASTRQAELMGTVRLLLADEYVPVRFAAAVAIGDTRYAPARSAVAQLFTDPDEDENVRIAAAYAMAGMGQGGLEFIRKAIRSSDQKIRANAAFLLGKSGDRSATGLLYQAMRSEDSDDKVRLNAAEGVARLGDERILQKLWVMLISVYADERASGVRAMGALGTVQARDALITMLDDDILEVRLMAAEQLGMLGETTGEPEVIEVFKKKLTNGPEKGAAERVSVLAALAIGQIGTGRLQSYLPELIKNESKFVRIAAAKAVLQCINREHIGR